MAELEQTYRRLWCHTRASVEVSRRMFDGYAGLRVLARRAGSDAADRRRSTTARACVARLRRIMEDPQQLLSNCVADYVVDELRKNGNRPECVPIPGFTNAQFATLPVTFLRRSHAEPATVDFGGAARTIAP